VINSSASAQLAPEEYAFSVMENTQLALPLGRHSQFQLTAIRCEGAAQAESALSDGNRPNSGFLFGFSLEGVANGRKQLLRAVRFGQEIFYTKGLKLGHACLLALSG
jgi:hypothetical protein